MKPLITGEPLDPKKAMLVIAFPLTFFLGWIARETFHVHGAQDHYSDRIAEMMLWEDVERQLWLSKAEAQKSEVV